MNLKLGTFWAALATVACVAGCGDNEERGVSEAEAPPELIEPGVCVGKVHAGMTLDQVRAQLGEPQLTTHNSLEYTRRGFAVMPGPDGVVQVVMCGDVTGINGPMIKRFRGRTKEGVGLGSTREELIKSYGEPSNDEKFPGSRESMKYDSLGITFSLENGKVHHMIVRLKAGDSNQPPANSIQISP